MMAACEMTLEDGTEGRPTCLGDKSQLRARDPFPLKTLTRIDRCTDRCVMLHHSDAKEGNVILKLFQMLKHYSLSKLHMHNIIII